MAKILLVDDEPTILTVLTNVLNETGTHEVLRASGGEQALEFLATQDIALMISDIRMSPMDGMTLLKSAREKHPALTVILITAFGSAQTAVDAQELGVFDYITKPFKIKDLLSAANAALEHSAAQLQGSAQSADTGLVFTEMVARSSSMLKLCEMIRRVGPTDTPVLIYGPKGSEKELVAQAIHMQSRRKDNVFLSLNCSLFPEPVLGSEIFGNARGAGPASDKNGILPSAEGGTVLLDNISEMPLSIQDALLTTLTEKTMRQVGGNQDVPIDVRLLFGSSVSLETRTKEGKFRDDLMHRVSMLPMEIQALAKRPEDIVPLAQYVLRTETPEGHEAPAIDQDASSILESYSWPGNFTELASLMKDAFSTAHAGNITKDSLPPEIKTSSAKSVNLKQTAPKAHPEQGRHLKTFIRHTEKKQLETVLEHTDGNREEAARMLGMSLTALDTKLDEED